MRDANFLIQQLNNITQQNAAVSEEMATSAEELSSQAQQLKETMQFFKTGNFVEAITSPKQELNLHVKTSKQPVNQNTELAELELQEDIDEEEVKFENF
ncbi:MAG: hypothetical protein MI922_14430 [Bacteroidales bacterium]|nr:hypothetical protein [Bacteroidales bacterium]